MKTKIALVVLLFFLFTVSSSLVMNVQAVNFSCEQCGRLVDSASQAHFRVTDENGTVHYVECMMCALELLSKYGALNITAYCDYNGPDSVITVDARQYGSVVTVSPSSALFIAGDHPLNRVVRDQVSATALLAINGSSRWLAPIQQYVNGESGALNVVPANATIMGLADAALNFGGGASTPTPSVTASPIASPSFTSSPAATETPTSSAQATATPLQTSETSPSPASTATPATSPQETYSSQSPGAEPSEPATNNDSSTLVLALIAVAAVAVAAIGVVAYMRHKR